MLRSFTSLALLFAGQAGAPPILEIGIPLNEMLGSASARAETPAILASAGDRIPAVTFEARVAEPGSYHIDLVSHAFDAYVVLRDASGALVAESNGGLVGPHARVVVDLVPGDYRVDACALDRRTGPFEVRIARGRPAELTPEERDVLELEDARAGVAALTALEPGGSQLASALERLADRLLAAGRLAEAHETLGELLRLRESNGKLLDAARVASRCARVALDLGATAEARGAAERAVTLFESERGADDPETAEARLLLGTLDFASGRAEQAVTNLDRALHSLSTALGPTEPRTISALGHLSNALASLGRFAEVRRRGEHFLPILRETLGGNDPATRALLASLAEAARVQGDLFAARLWLVELVQSADSLSAAEGLTRAELAGVLAEQGRGFAAAEELESALGLLEITLGEDAPESVDCALALARAHASIGKDESAHALLERVLTQRELEGGPARTAEVRLELGRLAAHSGRTPRARELLERAHAEFAASVGSDHPRTLAVGLELARLADGNSSADALEHIVEAATRALGADHALVGRACVELGRSHARDGRASEAGAELERGRAILAASLGAGHAESLSASNALARVRIDAGDVEGARRLFETNVAARRLVAWESFDHATERARFASLGAEREELELYFSLGRGRTAKDSSEHDLAAYEAYVRWHAFRASERFAGRAAFEQQARGAEALLADLVLVRTRIARRAEALEPAAEQVGMAELHRRAREVGAELVRRFGSPPARLPYERLAWSLPPKSALVDFASLRPYHGETSGGSFGEPHLFASITRSSPARFARVDLGPSAEIGGLVAAFVEALRDHANARERSDALAERAAALIWRPIAALLGDERSIFVVPDPLIAALPFEALPAGDGALLLERVAFVQLTDVSRLAGRGGVRAEERSKEGERSEPALLAVGAVDYGGGTPIAKDASFVGGSPPAGETGAYRTEEDGELLSRAWRPSLELAALEASGAEIDLVSGMHAALPGRKGRRLALRGSEASAERLASAMPGQSVIHLATHLVHSPAAPLFDPLPSSAPSAPGALAPGRLAGLAVAAGSASGTLLETRSLGLLDLDGVDLVALTGAALDPGNPRAGDDLLGIVHALESAGARAVVASRWRPAEGDLLPLLEAFYRELWVERRDPPDALRRAQLGILARARATDGDPHPERWAALFATLTRP